MMEVFEAHGINIRSFHYCLHGKQAGCSCRKPEVGLFKEAVQGIAYNQNETFFIGDKATDVEAGKKFGVKTIFVRTGHGKTDEVKLQGVLKPDYAVDTLMDAVEILRHRAE